MIYCCCRVSAMQDTTQPRAAKGLKVTFPLRIGDRSNCRCDHTLGSSSSRSSFLPYVLHVLLLRTRLSSMYNETLCGRWFIALMDKGTTSSKLPLPVLHEWVSEETWQHNKACVKYDSDQNPFQFSFYYSMKHQRKKKWKNEDFWLEKTRYIIIFSTNENKTIISVRCCRYMYTV